MSTKHLSKCIRPVVEHLEGRQLMSVTITQFDDSEGHHTLRIRGDGKNDTVTILDDNSLGQVNVVANGVPSTWFYPDPSDTTLGEIEVIDVDLKGGNDSISFSQSPTADPYHSETRAIHLDGDVGNDTINFSLPLGLTKAASVTAQIDGDSGNDSVSFDIGDLHSSELDVDVTCGDGNDTVNGALPTLLDGAQFANFAADVSVAIDLGNGKNTATLVAVNSVIQANSVLDVDVKGGDSTGSNFDTITLDFNVSSVEGKLFVDVAALAGDDKITANLDALSVGTFDVDSPWDPTFVLNVNGGDGKDQITAQALQIGLAVDEHAFASMTLRGGNGDDKINALFGTAVGVEAGGQFVLNVDGQNNNDTIVARLAFTDLAGAGGGQADVSIKGGQNTDNISFFAIDQSTNGIVFGPSLFGPLVDGQTGTDKATLVLGGITPTVRNFESSTTTFLP